MIEPETTLATCWEPRCACTRVLRGRPMPAIVGVARAARFILPVGIRVPRSLLPSALSRAGGGDGDPTGDAVTRGRPCPGGRGTSPAPRVAVAAALHLERHDRCPAGRVQ